MADEEQGKHATCCGLAFFKRRPKRHLGSHRESGKDHSKENNKDNNKDANKDINSDINKDNLDPGCCQTSPINLAGITLNLNIATPTGMEKTHEETDNRLEEFKQLFCGGNELHSVDFIRIWGFYDKDHSGYLETKELDKFIKDLILQKGQKPYPEMVKNVREAVLKSADVNKDGKIELSEFARCLPVEKNFLLQFDNSRNVSNPRKVLTRKEFNEIFKHYDPDGNGFIEGHEILALLRDILSKLGMEVGAQELVEYRDNVIKVYDKNADGKLSRDELGMLLSVDK